MMDGILVRCNYCKTTVLLRFQMGYFNIPFDICCPTCGVHINGIRKIVDKHSFDVNNATVIDRGTNNINFFSDFSVELPHRKTTKYESLESLVNSGFSPFMMTSQLYSFDTYEKLMKRMQRFSFVKDKIWTKLSPLYDIYFNGKLDLLKEPLEEFSKAYIIKNSLDASMALHQLLVSSFVCILPEGVLNEFGEYANKIMLTTPPQDVNGLIAHLGRKVYFESNGKRVVNIFTRWFDMFETFIPAIMLTLGNVKGKIDKLNYGIATTSFESFKNFYSDTYEIILDMIDIAVGLNNISVRGNIDCFPNDRKCQDFDSYRRLAKAQKFEKLVLEEPFCKTIDLNRNIRNAIAHFSFDYDVRTQEIVFRDKHGRTENGITLYLIELACLCYDNMVILFYFNELVYALRKVDFIQDGLMPNIKSDLLTIANND